MMPKKLKERDKWQSELLIELKKTIIRYKNENTMTFSDCLGIIEILKFEIVEMIRELMQIKKLKEK